MVAAGIYAITLDRPAHHGDAAGACVPSRASTLTGAYQNRHQPSYPPQADEYLQQQAAEVELQQQAAEIERLRAVIRQRNRIIKQLRAQLEEQPVERPATTGTVDRFAHLEIRGQSW